ncbi:heat shock factor protein 5-like [Saimiri boliviensis]|uniref:heat shock factor protein 5-like n=1 Tax=Saimiri boliviensis TaxID=27679 RepID=UPI003D77E854
MGSAAARQAEADRARRRPRRGSGAGIEHGEGEVGWVARGNGPPAGTAAARGCSSTSRSSRWSCSARPGREAAAGPRGRGRARALHNHQLHQLRPPAQRLRLPQGGAGGAETGPGWGRGAVGRRDRPLHHFRSPHFRRGQPQLLVHLQRRTGSNEAKLAAGLEVPCRPPSGFQWLPAAAHHLGLRLRPLGRRPDPAAAPGAATCAADSRPEPHGPGAVGQFHRSLRRGGFPPYSYVTSSQDRSTFPMKSLDRTPVPRGIWQNSLGMHPGQVETSPTFSEKRSCFAASVVRACCPVCLGC